LRLFSPYLPSFILTTHYSLFFKRETMPTALIIGASRGIGHELVRQYCADGWNVIATVRKAGDAAGLEQLGAQTRLLDVTDAAQVAAFAAGLQQQRLDVAILNAGVFGPGSDPMTPPSQADFDAVMHTNVLAALWLLPRIGPLVAAAQGRLAVVSSEMGSLGSRGNSSATVYRASKAALNSVLLDVAQHLAPMGACCVSLHPGWVRTDMGGPEADIAVEESVSGIRATLAGLTANDNARFLNYDGSTLAW
jgi:NAD(P)-dependent dehydrogenase (short-subunit alcohol dehydrogenase family)